MRTILTISILFLLLITPAIPPPARADDSPATLDTFRKFDEYGDIRFSHEKARLDNVAIELLSDPKMVVYLWIYSGKRSCRGQVRARGARAKAHLVNRRGIAADRVVWKNAGYRQEFTVEVWVWPRGVREPTFSPTVDPSEVLVVDCSSKKQD